MNTALWIVLVAFALLVLALAAGWVLFSWLVGCAAEAEMRDIEMLDGEPHGSPLSLTTGERGASR